MCARAHSPARQSSSAIVIVPVPSTTVTGPPVKTEHRHRELVVALGDDVG